MVNHKEQKRTAIRRGFVTCLLLALWIPGQASGQQEYTLQQKLDEIVIPKVNFDSAKLTEVVKFVEKKSAELDPEGEGVNFLLRLRKDWYKRKQDEQAEEKVRPAPPGQTGEFAGFKGKSFEDFGTEPNTGLDTEEESEAETETKIPRITLHLEDIPLRELIDYICIEGDLPYMISSDGVIIASKEFARERLQRWIYPFEPNMAPTPNGDGYMFNSYKGDEDFFK